MLKTDRNVVSMLEVSTANISQLTAQWLEITTIDRNPLTVYEKGEYGFFIPLYDGLIEDLGERKIPEDLQAVLRYAAERQIDWVMFDRDADTVDGLPQYDW